MALVCLVINTIGKTVRWRVLMGEAGTKTSLKKILMVNIVGQMLNLFFPARTGDLARAYLMGNSNIERTYLLGTVILEKFFEVLAYGLLFLILVFVIPIPVWALDSVYVFLFFSLIFAVVLLLIAKKHREIIVYLQRIFSWLDERFPKLAQIDIVKHLHTGLESIQIINNQRVLVKTFLWTFVIWGMALLTNHLVLLAFRIKLPLTASLLLLVLLQIGITLPSIPSRIGLFEYICILSLAVFGISQPLALSYGFLLHGVLMIPVAVFGVIFSFVLGLPSRKTKSLDVSE